mgnify:FL=1
MIPNERIDMSELMEILREAAEEEREKKRKELEERLRKINEREETDVAEWAELLKKVGERGDEDHSVEMAAEIEEGREEAEKEIREKYMKEYGERDWNGNRNREAVKNLVHKLFGSE